MTDRIHSITLVLDHDIPNVAVAARPSLPDGWRWVDLDWASGPSASAELCNGDFVIETDTATCVARVPAEVARAVLWTPAEVDAMRAAIVTIREAMARDARSVGRLSEGEFVIETDAATCSASVPVEAARAVLGTSSEADALRKAIRVIAVATEQARTSEATLPKRLACLVRAIETALAGLPE